MQTEVIPLACIGLAVCCFGFFRLPRNRLELLSSRFILPLMIALATFTQSFWHFWLDVAVDKYQQARVDVGVEATGFLVVCMLFFWLGYVMPIGRSLCKPLIPLAVPVTPTRSTSTVAYFLCTLSFILFLLGVLAPAQLSAIPGQKVFSIVLIYIASAALGLSLPDRSQRGPVQLPIVLLWTLVVTLPLMSTFSRGMGIPALTVAAAHSIRRGRPNWLGIAVAVAVSIIGAEVAFGGRATVGHYAGVVAWCEYLFTGGIWSDWFSAFSSAMFANDSFTPLTVSIVAQARANIGALSPMDWLTFQIPIPHIFWFSPVFTLDLPAYLGGTGTWNYTPGIFGDLYIHLGWLGTLMFIIVGWVYRATDELAFRPVPEGTFNPFFLLLVFGYVAMALGLFNNFRSWNTAFFDGACVVVALLLLRKVFFIDAQQDELQYQASYDPGALTRYGQDY